MSRYWCSILALVFLVCPGCSSGEIDRMLSQSVVDTDSASTDGSLGAMSDGTGADGLLKLNVDVSGGFSLKSDPFSIDGLEMEGDVLKLSVSYGGGCETHHFVVWTDSIFSDSSPPRVKLFIGHDGRGDACEALIARDLRVDLTPIKLVFETANPEQKGGAVSITVEGSDLTVPYSFGN